MNMQRDSATIVETVLPPGRHDPRLAGLHGQALLLDPDLGFAGEHGQNLFHGVEVGRRAGAWRDPLLEHA